MKSIKLKGKYAENRSFIVDEEDFDRVNKYSWHVVPGRGDYFKIRAFVGDRRVYLGRFILNYTGDTTFQVNHKNHDVLDNRKENLELIHRDENNLYRRKHKRNSTGFKGVTPHPKKQGKFVAQIETRINGKRKGFNLGTFDSAEQAARVYDKKCLELQGKFAILNFPDEAAL